MRFRLLAISLFSALLLIVLVMTSVSGASPSAEQSFQSLSSPGVNNLVSSANGLSFRLVTSVPMVTDAGKVAATGLNELSNVPGLPELPYFSTLILLPPEAEMTVSLSTGSEVSLANIQVQNVPQKQLSNSSDPFDNSLTPVGSPLNPEQKAAPEQKQGQFPGEFYQVSKPFYMRDLRLARLTIYPVRYDSTDQSLDFYPELNVKISFDGADFSNRQPAPTVDDQLIQGLTEQMLNGDKIEEFRSLPPGAPAAGTALPVGTPTFKIEVNQDGIYELTYAALSAAGMNVASVNPKTFEMNYRGESVAYEFVGDTDTSFEPGEKIRFFGQAFDGSRHDRLFIDNNVFWLWAGGTPKLINTTNSLGGGTAVTEFRSSVTREEDNHYISIYTNWKDWYPNEADTWYWDGVSTFWDNIEYRTYSINLPHPANSGPNADFTAEFSTRDTSTGNFVYFTTVVTMNNHLNGSSASWYYENNYNITGSVPQNILNDGANEFDVKYMSDAPWEAEPRCIPCTALNRITVEYQRELIATDDQLLFNADSGGLKEFQLENFSTNQPIIWNVSQSKSPTAIASGINVSGSGPYNFAFGTNAPSGSSFIATTVGNVMSPLAISKYIPTDLDPLSGGADWLAISHPDFLAQVQVLANHRSTPIYGGLSTLVVSVEDVINQYGYGLPVPSALQDYLKYAVENWSPSPSYALIVGDSTHDPRHINPAWTDEQYMLSDLAHVDPWQGEIPSDLIFSLLSGDPDDIAPDIALGRISAQNGWHVKAAVDKIIRYDQNQLQSYGWMENMLFVSDINDTAGNFLCQNKILGDQLPDALNAIYLPDFDPNLVPPETCYNYPYPDKSEINNSLVNQINNTGVTIVNYRGHGATDRWGGPILHTSDIEKFNNSSRPFVAVTGNCLDGKYNNPEAQGLGESLVRAASVPTNGTGIGAAAHFGSAGLGISFEHSAVIGAFYDAIFDQGITTLGDAVMAAKTYYGSLPGAYPSLVYSYVFQGDPAMHLFRPDLRLSHSAKDAVGSPGGEVQFQLDVSNFGVYPSHASVEHLLPAGFQFITATSSVGIELTDDSNPIKFDIQFGDGLNNRGIPRNETATVMIKAYIPPSTSLGQKTSVAAVTGTGSDYLLGNEAAQAKIMVMNSSAWLPVLIK